MFESRSTSLKQNLLAAKEKTKTIQCFETADEFYKAAQGFDRTIPVYIDVSLGDGVRGEDVAVKVAGETWM